MKPINIPPPAARAKLLETPTEALVFCQEFFDGLKTLKKHTFKFSQLWFTRQILVDGLLVELILRQQEIIEQLVEEVERLKSNASSDSRSSSKPP